jgi:hypothetical protein
MKRAKRYRKASRRAQSAAVRATKMVMRRVLAHGQKKKRLAIEEQKLRAIAKRLSTQAAAVYKGR